MTVASLGRHPLRERQMIMLMSQRTLASSEHSPLHFALENRHGLRSTEVSTDRRPQLAGGNRSVRRLAADGADQARLQPRVPQLIAPRVGGRELVARNSRAVIATSIGNMLEWYDFTVYALFAGYIAGNFFPAGDDPTTKLLKAFLFFGLGFVVRPLGAILIGNYGDQAGRKAALTLTILLMAVGTAVIAFSPAYSAIGLGAPLLLLLGRVLQGFSAGGEIGGATAFLLESADPRQSGRVVAWLQASMGMSNILGALAAFSVTAFLSMSEVQSWGWRLPFLFGLLILPVGIYLRRSLEETEAFQALAERRRVAKIHTRSPLLEIFRDHGRRLVVGFCVAVLWAVAVYVLMIFLPTYVQRADTFNFSARQAFGASLIGNIPFVIGCVVFGSVSDRAGRRKSLFVSATLLLICVLPLFMWLKANPTTMTLIIVQSIICILVSSFTGVAPSALAEIFPTAVRSTGMSLVYNGAFTVFGGFAPTILTWVTRRSGGSLFAPAWYVMLAAAVAMTAIPFLRSRSSPAEMR
jgi:MHS family proline/betaine transporter-like MFS transporter